jgi:hypothetical protein
MKAVDPHIPDDRVPESDEPQAQPYEPPSVTELGAFLELTAGGGGAFGDAVTASEAA